jgi:hypothetical protein
LVSFCFTQHDDWFCGALGSRPIGGGVSLPGSGFPDAGALNTSQAVNTSNTNRNHGLFILASRTGNITVV